MVTLEELEALRAVVRTGSFTAAAEELSLTQSAVSQRIRRLERTLGIEIFDRHGLKHRPRLTKAGTLVLGFADRVTLLHDLLRRDIRAEGWQDTQTIRIACIPMAAKYILPALVNAFYTQYPHARVQLLCCSARIINDMVMHGDVHLGFESEFLADYRVQSIPVVQDRLLLIGPPGRAMDLPTGSDGAGVDLPFVLTPPQSTVRHLVERWANVLGIRLQVVFESDSFDALTKAVAHGLGYSFVSEYVVAHAVAEERVEIVRAPAVPITRNLCVVFSRDQRLSSAAKAFLQFASDAAWPSAIRKLRGIVV